MVKACLLLPAAVALAAAQSTLLDLAMPDAKALFGINVERLRASRLAQGLWSQLPAQEPDLAGLIQATGFDPLRQLSEILIASPGGARQRNALLLVRGAFTGMDLLSLAKSRGAHSETFQGVEIVASGKEQPMAVALLEQTLLIAGDPASVRGAIARRGRPGQVSAELRRKAAELSAQYDLWGVSTLPPAELAAQAPEADAMGLFRGGAMKAIEEVSGGMRLRGDLQLMVNTVSRSEQDAANLANALRFFLSMAQSRQPAGQPFLQDLKRSGRSLTISASIPEAEVEKIIAAMRSGRRAGTASTPAAPAESGVTIYSSPSDMGVVKIPAPKPPQ